MFTEDSQGMHPSGDNDTRPMHPGRAKKPKAPKTPEDLRQEQEKRERQDVAVRLLLGDENFPAANLATELPHDKPREIAPWLAKNLLALDALTSDELEKGRDQAARLIGRLKQPEATSGINQAKHINEASFLKAVFERVLQEKRPIEELADLALRAFQTRPDQLPEEGGEFTRLSSEIAKIREALLQDKKLRRLTEAKLDEARKRGPTAALELESLLKDSPDYAVRQTLLEENARLLADLEETRIQVWRHMSKEMKEELRADAQSATSEKKIKTAV